MTDEQPESAKDLKKLLADLSSGSHRFRELREKLGLPRHVARRCFNHVYLSRYVLWTRSLVEPVGQTHSPFFCAGRFVRNVNLYNFRQVASYPPFLLCMTMDLAEAEWLFDVIINIWRDIFTCRQLSVSGSQ